MKEMVLELISSYEDRIATVEELITSAHGTVVARDVGLDGVDEEREKLKASLQQTLARNCSLRRKDFHELMGRLLADSERRRQEIAEERRGVVERVQGHLEQQKELARGLKQRLLAAQAGPAEKAVLDEAVEGIRKAYGDRRPDLLTTLRAFESHLETFRREQAGFNARLKTLLEKGEALRVEDLRQLETARVRGELKAARQERREEVGRLLAGFKEHREKATATG